MEIINYSNARKNFAATLQRTIDDCEPITITRQTGGNVVLMSEADYRAHMETLYLFSTPANAVHLLNALADFEAGNVVEMDLIE